MGHDKRTQRHVIVGAVIALALVGVVLAVLDWRELQQVVGQARWEPAALALLFTAISYACLSTGFAVVNRAFGIRLGWRDLVEVGFASIALNHIMAFGGVAGYSLRLLFLRQRGLVTQDILAASLFHSYFNNLAMFALLPVGLIYLLMVHPLSQGAAVGIGVTSGLLVLAFAVASMVVFIRSMRAALLRLVGRLWRTLTHRNIGPALGSFDEALACGVAAIRRQPVMLALTLALIVADWGSTVVTLGFCFDALGSPVGAGTLLTGFAIGVVLGTLSMVPGGLGVQDSSMAGAFALLGLPLEKAVLASVLFRAVYYFIPFAISLVFYRHLLHKVGQHQDGELSREAPTGTPVNASGSPLC